MAALGGESYSLVRFLLHRGLAIIYLVAFLVVARQFRPLAGVDGLLPLDRYVDRRSFAERPSLFHLVPDDRVNGVAAWAGVALSVVAPVAGPSWLPSPYAVPASILLWATIWLLYLSFVNAGQVFYAFGWESMLLETGFLAIFLGAGDEIATLKTQCFEYYFSTVQDSEHESITAMAPDAVACDMDPHDNRGEFGWSYNDPELSSYPFPAISNAASSVDVRKF